MTVSIVDLAEDPANATCRSEGEVLLASAGRFSRVRRCAGDAFDQTVDSVVGWFGDAARSGTEETDGKLFRWIELDTVKTAKLFKPSWNQFQASAHRLSSLDFGDFCSRNFGANRVEHTLRDLLDAYDFAPICIIDEFGHVTTAARWLRDVRYGRRFYITAAYAGQT